MGLLNLLRRLCCCTGYRWYRYQVVYDCEAPGWGTVELTHSGVGPENAHDNEVWTQGGWGTSRCTYEMWIRGTPTDEPAEVPDPPDAPTEPPDDCCNDCNPCESSHPGEQTCYSSQSRVDLLQFNWRVQMRASDTLALFVDFEWELLAPAHGLVYAGVGGFHRWHSSVERVVQMTDHLASVVRTAGFLTGLNVTRPCEPETEDLRAGKPSWGMDWQISPTWADDGWFNPDTLPIFIAGNQAPAELLDAVAGHNPCGVFIDGWDSGWGSPSGGAQRRYQLTLEARVGRNHCCLCEECVRRYMSQCVDYSLCADCDGAAERYAVQLPAALGGGVVIVTRDAESEWLCAWSAEVEGVSVDLHYQSDDCPWRLLIDGPGGTWEGAMDQHSLPDGDYQRTGGTLFDAELTVQEVL